MMNLSMILNNLKRIAFLGLLLFSAVPAFAQHQPASAELFQQARKVAADDKDYVRAIALSKKALADTPDDTDIQVFIGRLYTWSNQADSARRVFDAILQKNNVHEDAVFAYANLEFWNGNLEKALHLVNQGLAARPDSKDLLLLKTKLLADLGKLPEAGKTVSFLLEKDARNAAARALADRIKDGSTKNKAGLSYDLNYFDKQFKEPWHLVSLDYSRYTAKGSVTARLNYASRFSDSGTQLEVESYPKISKTFYAYAGAAYSGSAGIFPRYKAGFSLYASLPAAIEAEVGLRFMHFSGDAWIYTLSAGKYYKNYWFNIRTYLGPSAGSVSQSYAVNLRYYYGGSDDYLSFGASTGISPDDAAGNVLFNAAYKLHSRSLYAGFRHLFNNRNIILLNASLANQEYGQHQRGKQFGMNIGYQRKF